MQTSKDFQTLLSLSIAHQSKTRQSCPYSRRRTRMGQFKPPLSAVTLPSPPPPHTAYRKGGGEELLVQRMPPMAQSNEIASYRLHFPMHKCLGNNGNRRAAAAAGLVGTALGFPPRVLPPPQLLIPLFCSSASCSPVLTLYFSRLLAQLTY